MDAIKWGAPPVRERKGRPLSKKWLSIAEQLKTNPGEWAVVAENVSPSYAALIRSGGLRAFESGKYEAVSRGIENNRAKEIYARYVG